MFVNCFIVSSVCDATLSAMWWQSHDQLVDSFPLLSGEVGVNDAMGNYVLNQRRQEPCVDFCLALGNWPSLLGSSASCKVLRMLGFV